MASLDLINKLYDIFIAHPRISTDSRNIPAGSMFFALKGNSFDGNMFAEEALEKGAAYVIIDDRDIQAELSRKGLSEKAILTDNVLETLQALAAHHRSITKIPVIAITGTNGKTTTKELTAAVLSAKYNLISTKGNLNNHIGVPLTLLTITKDTEIAIVEMGASARGEIKLLCETAKPDYGIITNIGRAHLEGFGDEEGVRRGKGELYDWLEYSGGTAIVRSDDPILKDMAAERKGMRTVFYDTSYADGMESRLAGDYNRANIAAAVAVGKIFRITDKEIKEAISSYDPDNNRSQKIVTGNNIIISDCYNANPSSMRAAVESFFGAGSENVKYPKKTLILGDMLELGQYADSEHLDIVKIIADKKPDNVFFIGDIFSKVVGAARNDVHFDIKTCVAAFGNVRQLGEYLKKHPVINHCILIKGSNGIALHNIIKEL